MDSCGVWGRAELVCLRGEGICVLLVRARVRHGVGKVQGGGVWGSNLKGLGIKIGHTVAPGLGRITTTDVELHGFAYGLGAGADIE